MNLTQTQLDVVKSVEGHYVVLAGPGCGKTRTITEKIGYLFKENVIPDPYSVLALTFTDASARIMRSRLRDMGFDKWSRLWVGTFHSFGYFILSCYGSDIGVSEDFEIIEDNTRNNIIERSIDEHSFNLNTEDEGKDIERMKRSGLYPDQVGKRLSGEELVVYRDYQNELQRRHLIDLGDLVSLAVRLLQSSDFVRRVFTESFRYVIVDEFQDTDNQQLEMVKILAKSATGSTVVGDDDQSIFGWRGALRENISRIKMILNSKEIIMGANFRSDRAIVEAAEKVIGEDLSRTNKDISPISSEKGKLFKREFDNPEEEAESIASWIEGILNKGEIRDLGNIAVITRTHYRVNQVLNALKVRGIPWFDRHKLTFRESWETALALSVLELAGDPNSSLYLHRAMKAVEDGGLAYQLGEEDALIVAVKLMEILRKARLPAINTDNCSQILNAIGIQNIIATTSSGTSDRNRRLKNVKALLADVVKLSKEEGIGLVSTVDRLSNLGAVQILSSYEAKGTEFEVVFLAGLEDDILPYYRAQHNEETLAEERRVFYVELTRARKACYMTCALHRSNKYRTMDTIPSRFLKSIPSEYFESIS